MEKNVLEEQFHMFLNKLKNEKKYKSQENIETHDPKDMIKHFLTS